jgi:membrane fusion protein (multidrug efflux system)
MMRAILLSIGMLAACPALAQSVTAVLEPSKTAEIRSTVAGRIADITVDEGDRVTTGASLIQMDNAVQMARVTVAAESSRADGQLQRAKAAVDEAAARADRIAQARTRGAAQSWEVDAAQQALRIAQAEQVMAQEAQGRAAGQLQLEEAILEEFLLRAPFDGTVLQVFKETGEIVDTQQVLIAFGHLRTLEATAFMPVTALDDLTEGQSIPATIDTGSARIDTNVTVHRIDPRIDPASRTVRVTLMLANEDLDFPAGATLELTPG